MADRAASGTVAKSRRLERVSAACDLCKARKVKCDGSLPCAYCTKRNRAAICTFSTPRTRGTRSNSSRTPSATAHETTAVGAGSSNNLNQRLDDVPEDARDTAVPLEARLLQDAEGKSLFIGDCAPISFLQTVRYLVATCVDSQDLPASRDSIIEWAPPPQDEAILGGREMFDVDLEGNVERYVAGYATATHGLVDLFAGQDVIGKIKECVRNPSLVLETPSFWTWMLVLAIGAQESESERAATWFAFSQQRLMSNMCGNMTVTTVQGFTLVAIYLLRASQPNGAYLYLSLAARTAYAIGIHRTEANASFGSSTHILRDRIWQSLRVVDIFISCLLGRPPSTSDVDCTVKYSNAELTSAHAPDNLIANVQIFMILERIVVEVYSRKRISLRIAEFVSHQLKTWATDHLRPLTKIATSTDAPITEVVGATQTLCSYFYGIMLLTRPFLIYDLYEYLGTTLRRPGSRSDNEQKKKFADATIDAAIAFVEQLERLQESGRMPHKMPLVVSWLFTTALVLAIGMLGSHGISLKGDCAKAISCLQYFESSDMAAHQYIIIVQALQNSISMFVQRQRDRLRDRRRIASSELFGLLSSDGFANDHITSPTSAGTHMQTSADTTNMISDAPACSDMGRATSAEWNIYDADFFAVPWPTENDAGLQDFLQPGRFALDGSSTDIPLFPLHDQDVTPRELLFMPG